MKIKDISIAFLIIKLFKSKSYTITIILAMMTVLTANAGIKERLEGEVTYTQNIYTCDTVAWADSHIIIEFSSERRIKAYSKSVITSWEHINIVEHDSDYIVVQDLYGVKYYMPTDDNDKYFMELNGKTTEMTCTYKVVTK